MASTLINKDNLWAVVVWYHPTEEQKANVDTYAPYVHRVVIVDNTDDNIGIAAALNRGIRECIAGGAKWVLTMDQDSCFNDNENDNDNNIYSLRHYIAEANAYPDIADVGLFSPVQDYRSVRTQDAPPYRNLLAVMTSGNLLNTAVYQQTHGFREEFFIDEVDNEYCIQLHELGYSVTLVTGAHLRHQLGERQTIRLLGLWKKEIITHTPQRYYYMSRNNRYCQQLHPQQKTFFQKRLRRLIKRVLLYENGKIEKLRMIINGWNDGRKK